MKHLTLDEYTALSPKERTQYMFGSILAASEDGHQTALGWTDTWRSGGPCCFHPRANEPELTREFFSISVKCHEAWMEAFNKTYKASGKTCIK